MRKKTGKMMLFLLLGSIPYQNAGARQYQVASAVNIQDLDRCPSNNGLWRVTCENGKQEVVSGVDLQADKVCVDFFLSVKEDTLLIDPRELGKQHCLLEANRRYKLKKFGTECRGKRYVEFSVGEYGTPPIEECELFAGYVFSSSIFISTPETERLVGPWSNYHSSECIQSTMTYNQPSSTYYYEPSSTYNYYEPTPTYYNEPSLTYCELSSTYYYGPSSTYNYNEPSSTYYNEPSSTYYNEPSSTYNYNEPTSTYYDEPSSTYNYNEPTSTYYDEPSSTYNYNEPTSTYYDEPSSTYNYNEPTSTYYDEPSSTYNYNEPTSTYYGEPSSTYNDQL